MAAETLSCRSAPPAQPLPFLAHSPARPFVVTSSSPPVYCRSSVSRPLPFVSLAVLSSLLLFVAAFCPGPTVCSAFSPPLVTRPLAPAIRLLLLRSLAVALPSVVASCSVFVAAVAEVWGLKSYWGITIARFKTPVANPWPPPESAVNSAVTENGTLYVIASGKPKRANTTKAAIRIEAFPPITCSIPPEYLPRDIKLMMEVTAMQANTLKLLVAHTILGPNL